MYKNKLPKMRANIIGDIIKAKRPSIARLTPIATALSLLSTHLNESKKLGTAPADTVNVITLKTIINKSFLSVQSTLHAPGFAVPNLPVGDP